MNIVAIIQARTGSTRLPDKVFLDLKGNPLIWHVFNRIKKSKYINSFVLATTKNKKDDRLENWALENNILLYRGNENDVLDRYYQAANMFKADIIVRITADDPLKDVDVLDSVINEFLIHNVDFAFNNNPVSFPEGMDVEVFKYNALKIAHLNSTDSFEREHVTQYFHRNPELFSKRNISNLQDFSNLRWTIDTLEDYKLIQIIYNKLYDKNKSFKFKDIILLIESNPKLATLNIYEKRSEMYKNKNLKI